MSRDRKLAKFIRRGLERSDLGFQHVESIEEIFRPPEFRIPQAIVIDIGASGRFDGTWSLVARRNFPDVPIILIGDREDRRATEETLSTGAQDYIIRREVTPELLLRVIRHAISRQRFISDITRNRDETAAHALRQTIVAGIGRLISSAAALDDVYEEIATELSRAVRFDRLAAHLINWEDDTFSVHPISGDGYELADLGQVRPISGSITGKAALYSEVTVFTRADLEPFASTFAPVRWAVDNGYQVIFGAPLIVVNRCIGVLFAASRNAESDTPLNRSLISDVADHMAGPIQQLHDRQEAEEIAFEQSSLAAIGRKLIQTPDAESGIAAVVDDICEMVPCDTLLINLIDEDEKHFHSTFLRGTPTDPVAARRRVLKGSVTEHALASNLTYRLDGALTDPDEGRTPAISAIAHFGYRSGLAVPLKVGAEQIGSLLWLDRAEERYSAHSCDLATAIGSQVGGAIANAELRRRTSELAEEHSKRLELEHENATLQAANEMKYQILSNVSHELRTPLTSVLAFADLLYRNPKDSLDEKQLEQLDVIRRGGRQLELIINDLLTTSSVDSNSFQLVASDVDVARLIESVTRIMQPIVISRSQSIENVVTTGDATIQMDLGRMTQVLCNLVSNASKYSPPSSKILIEASLSAGDLEISVADQGPGIPDGQDEAIFNRFFRIDDDSVRSQVGIGLGLHIAKTIVEAHNGSIAIDRSRDQGACFTIRLRPDIRSTLPSATRVEAFRTEAAG